MTPSMIIAVIGAVTGILGTLTAAVAIIQTRKTNQLAKDANTISKQALSVNADHTVYDWGFKFDQESSTLTMTNDSPNPAMNVAVSVRHEGKTIAESHIDRMAPFENASLKCELLSEKIREELPSIAITNPEGAVVYMDEEIVSVNIAVTWASDLGVKRSEKYEQSFP